MLSLNTFYLDIELVLPTFDSSIFCLDDHWCCFSQIA